MQPVCPHGLLYAVAAAWPHVSRTPFGVAAAVEFKITSAGRPSVMTWRQATWTPAVDASCRAATCEWPCNPHPFAMPGPHRCLGRRMTCMLSNTGAAPGTSMPSTYL